MLLGTLLTRSVIAFLHPVNIAEKREQCVKIMLGFFYSCVYSCLIFFNVKNAVSDPMQAVIILLCINTALKLIKG